MSYMTELKDRLLQLRTLAYESEKISLGMHAVDKQGATEIIFDNTQFTRMEIDRLLNDFLKDKSVVIREQHTEQE